MSNDDTRNDGPRNEDFETRTKNLLDAIIENQAKFSEDLRNTQAKFSERMDKMQQNAATIQEAVLGLIQVARTHDEQIDRNSEQIREINESLKEQREHIDTLIRVVESHVSNHK